MKSDVSLFSHTDLNTTVLSYQLILKTNIYISIQNSIKKMIKKWELNNLKFHYL